MLLFSRPIELLKLFGRSKRSWEKQDIQAENVLLRTFSPFFSHCLGGRSAGKVWDWMRDCEIAPKRRTKLRQSAE
jgi:hypothetical protein